MIYLYYGKIGDGKTYHVVANELLPAVYNGRKIYTNIDGLNKKYIGMLTGKLEHELNIVYLDHPEVIKDLLSIDTGDREGNSLKIEKGSLVVIDESQMIWDAREFRDTKKGFLTLLEYHRHFGLDLVFITQNPKRLESSIVRLANESYQVKNLGFLGAFLRGRYIIHIRQTPMDREVISTIRGKYRPEIFQCYRSYVSTAKHIKNSKGALQGFKYYATAILLILSVSLFVIRGGFTFMSPEKVKSLTASKGGSNVGTNSEIPDFVYDGGSSPGSVSSHQEKGQTSVVQLQHDDDCFRYSGIGGQDYFRRGDTVLVKRDGVWFSKRLFCSDIKDENKNGF